MKTWSLLRYMFLLWIRAKFPCIDFSLNRRLNDAVLFKVLNQTWSHSSDNIFGRHCSYSTKVHVVIFMKLSSDRKQGFTIKHLSGTSHPTCTIIRYFANTRTHNAHITLLKN